MNNSMQFICHLPRPLKLLSLCPAAFNTLLPKTSSLLLLLIHSKPDQNNNNSQTNKNDDPLHNLKIFKTLTKTLVQNPRNFTALRALDTVLAHSHGFDSATSLFAIDCLSKLRKLGRAKAVLQNMRVKGRVFDPFLYSIVVDCLVKGGKIDDCETVWGEICGSQLGFSICDYVIYVCKCGEACDVKMICERVLLGCRVLNRQSYAALVGALCRDNESMLAKEVIRVMDDQGIDIDDLSYFVMFRCFCRNGDLDEADFILKKLVRRNYQCDICVYSNFMYALCKTGKIREAEKLFRKVVRNDGYAMCKTDSLKEGRRVIFQLNFKVVIPEMVAYEAFFMSLCSVGKLNEAEDLLKKMVKKKSVPKFCVYGSFIKALFKAGREEDAIKFFNLKRKKGFVRADELAKFVIIELCEKGKVDDALRIFSETIRDEKFVNCIDLCNYVLAGYWKIKRAEEAENFFHKLRSGCYGVPNLYTYKTMIEGYCNEGSLDLALCVLEEMQKREIVVDRELYEKLIRSLCSCGRFNDAFVYFNEMLESGDFVSCLNSIMLFDSMFIQEG